MDMDMLYVVESDKCMQFYFTIKNLHTKGTSVTYLHLPRIV